MEPPNHLLQIKPVRRAPSPSLKKINQKVMLWRGDLCQLGVDALVNTTNEKLSDKTGICGRIFLHGGPELTRQCNEAENCPTGEAIITVGGNLFCKHVIHTVGPRFSLKYRTAAENALHACYRRALELAKENSLHSVAFPILNTERKGYPRLPAAHIAIRTVRRFLDAYSSGLDTVMFVISEDDAIHWEIYQDLLAMYFPRSEQEEKEVLPYLPADVGNELGETVIEDRKIKIGVGQGNYEKPKFQMPPKPIKDPVIAEQKQMLQASFASMQDHPDELRQKQDESKSKAERDVEEGNRRYNKFLREALSQDLTDMAALNFIYHSGEDASGRANIVFVSSHLPVETANLNRVLMYMVKVCDPLVSKDFNVIYFHTLFRSANKPPFQWLKDLYALFNRKYKKNMKRIFIVHPTFWTKMVLWFAKPFVSVKVWKKLHTITRLREIYQYFDPKTLRIPEAIHKFDLDQFGADYGVSASKLDDGL